MLWGKGNSKEHLHDPGIEKHTYFTRVQQVLALKGKKKNRIILKIKKLKKETKK